MKNVILISLLSLAAISCQKCESEDPRARIINEGTESVSVHIETSGGNTININNIDGGESSEFSSYAPGIVEFTITVGNGGNSDDFVSSVNMLECFEYEIMLDQYNVITYTAIDRNE